MSVKYACIIFLLALAGCSTATQSNPPRTATEEMLISAAADRAAEKLAVTLPKGDRVFIDAGNFDGTDAKYAIASIHAHLLRQGVRLVDDKKKAHTIVELRSGALSTDKDQTLVGIPSFSIPIPLSTGSLPFPEIALYKDENQRGIAKFAIVAYDAKQGKLIDAQEPQYGFARKTNYTVLIFISWTKNNYLPEGVDEDAPAQDTTQITPGATN